MTRIEAKPGGTRIADLRAGLRASANRSRFEKAPPKPKKNKPPRETADERAAKAERQALAQHTTSLLNGGKSGKSYVRVGEREQRKGTVLGLIFQLVLVVGAVGGIAYAIDPTLLPPEWSAAALNALDHIKTHELVRDWWPA